MKLCFYWICRCTLPHTLLLVELWFFVYLFSVLFVFETAFLCVAVLVVLEPYWRFYYENPTSLKEPREILENVKCLCLLSKIRKKKCGTHYIGKIETICAKIIWVSGCFSKHWLFGLLKKLDQILILDTSSLFT